MVIEDTQFEVKKIAKIIESEKVDNLMDGVFENIRPIMFPNMGECSNLHYNEELALMRSSSRVLEEARDSIISGE